MQKVKSRFTLKTAREMKRYTQEEAAKLINASKRPFIFVGGGAVAANAWEEVRERRYARKL